MIQKLKNIKLAVIGLGYVGLPLALAFSKKRKLIGFDINQNRTGVLNHAVLLVGFDYDDNGMYWIIQNSWGPEWGDRGFCKIRAVPGDGILLCQQYGVYPTKIYDPSNDRLNYEI